MTRQSTFAAEVERVCRRIDLSRFPSPITVRSADYSVDGAEADVVLSMQVKHVNTGFPTTINQSTVLNLEAVGWRTKVAGVGFDRAVTLCVWDMAKRLVLHELQECLFVDGHQVSDPHADEKDDRAKRAEMARLGGSA